MEPVTGMCKRLVVTSWLAAGHAAGGPNEFWQYGNETEPRLVAMIRWRAGPAVFHRRGAISNPT